ncbi:MAG: hypothetical protein CVU56_23125 [Deltaproteobacteria bacterium HGW-Deltaproteobacteria-14]|nr:MAG: hypothetical protein CVU56_23125 [Deltaproteobacteria bacterium HGW-Deltaproteobacteria-14]
MAAFEQLYRAHAPTLMARIIRPRLAVAADQEDVLVDTFRTALEKIGSYRWMGRSFFAWLARIAKNKVVDLVRARRSGARAVERLAVEPAPPSPAEPDWELLAGARDARLRDAIDVVLGDINERYAHVLQIRFIDGTPRAACAAAMEVKVGTFDVLVLRAVRAFRAAWVARYGTEEIP